MNLISFEKVYEENRKLDAIFVKKYDHPLLVKKNKLELLVEIGELANETRCFKYWSSKPCDRELVGLELADCFIMTLCFFNVLNVKLDEEFPTSDIEGDNIDCFFKIYEETVTFINTESCETLKKLFVSLILLGEKLGFSEHEIIEKCLTKIAIDMKRLSV